MTTTIFSVPAPHEEPMPTGALAALVEARGYDVVGVHDRIERGDRR